MESKNGKALSKEEVEEAFDGNLCRCTGYRPILDAFRSFASEGRPVKDIEDLVCCKSKDLRAIGRLTNDHVLGFGCFHL